MPESGRRERNKLEKLSRILKSAQNVFAERGEAGATTAEIADRADVAHGTLFRYAATKAELFIMVGNENLRLAIERGIEAASADAAPLDRLQAFLSPVVGTGWTLPNLAAYQRRVLDESASGYQRDIALHMVEQIVGVVVGILEDAWDRQGAPPPAEPSARAIYAVIHVEVLRAERDDHRRADFLTDIRAQAEIILRGYLATASASHNQGKDTTMSTIHSVTVLGTGVLGSQIAYQSAYSGFEVTAWDIDDAAVAAAGQRFTALAATYDAEVEGAKGGKSAAALARIRVTKDLADAVKDADLVIEAVPENPAIKVDTWTKVGNLAPEKTIFATNTSTLLPSSFMEATGRPAKFLALHYANRIWAMNTAEIMGTAKTDPAVFATVVEFAKEQGMVPIPLKKEQPGYVLNSLLVPLLNAASALLVNGVAEPETIDATWRIGTGAPLGPFQIFDVVGLTTAYNVSVMGDDTSKKFAELLKRDYIDQGKLGVATGEGFYRYS